MSLARLFPVNLIVLLHLAFCLTANAVDSGDSSDEDVLEKKRQAVLQEMRANRKKVANRFRGYGKYSKQFRALCDAMESDGRRDFFYKFGQENKIARDDCVACKYLYKQFSRSCRPKPKSKRKKKVDEASTEVKRVVKQREPHVIVIQRASEIGHILAEDSKYIHEHYLALEDFADKFRSSSKYSLGIGSYALLLYEALSSHFEEYSKALEREHNKSRSSQQSKSFYERDKAAEARELEKLFNQEMWP